MTKRNRDPFCCVRISSSSGFTLIELLIVIGILGALAMMVMSSTSADRTQLIDRSIVQAELSDIQRAFQKFQADCVPSDKDYIEIAKTGLDILMKQPAESERWTFPTQWNHDKQKGWRGPYLVAEGNQNIDASEYNGQNTDGNTTIKIIKTPYADDQVSKGGHYYRVVCDNAKNPTKLWVVMPKTKAKDGKGTIPDQYNPNTWSEKSEPKKSESEREKLTKEFEDNPKILKRLLWEK